MHRFFHYVFGLHEGTDVENTIAGIKSNVRVRGFNAWLLISAALLASAGLDTNSPAVIIGAMLISPLMSPILGIGLAIGIHDKETLLQSFKSFGIAVGISLFVSTLYFALTPLGEPTPEMLARIRPTLLDVLIAFFGGVAGIVAGSRTDKTVAIPGVAIATALMPPLCTAGFGLATGRGEFFLGAFYLFFINAVFISFATFLIVRWLKFPFVVYVDAGKTKRVTHAISIFVFLVMLPSGYFLYSTITEIHFHKQIQTFINKTIKGSERDVLRWEIARTDSLAELKLYMVGKRVSSIELESFNAELHRQADLDAVALKIVQMDIPKEQWQNLTSQVTLNVLKALEAQRSVIAAPPPAVTEDSLLFNAVHAEVRALFPDVHFFALGDVYQAALAADGQKMPLIVCGLPLAIKQTQLRQRREQLTAFLRTRLQSDSLRVLLIQSGF